MNNISNKFLFLFKYIKNFSLIEQQKFIILKNPYFSSLKNKKKYFGIKNKDKRIIKIKNKENREISTKKNKMIYAYNKGLNLKLTKNFYSKLEVNKSNIFNLINAILKIFIRFLSLIIKILSTIGISLSIFIYYIKKNNYDPYEFFKKTIITIISEKVCRNEKIINKISWEIFLLCKQEKIKKLMRDLIIKEILPNKGLKNDLYRITKREILAYMRSDQCKNELKNLIINEILRNYKITNDLFELIKAFVTKKETKMLENKLEKILTDVLCIEAIHKHVSNKMESEINRALRDEGIIKMAINMVTGDNDNNK